MSNPYPNIAYAGWRDATHWHDVMKGVGEKLGYPVITVAPATSFPDARSYIKALNAAFYDSPRPCLIVADDDALAQAPWMDDAARTRIEDYIEFTAIDNPGAFLTRIAAGDQGFADDFTVQTLRPAPQPPRQAPPQPRFA
jgi:hypothetical protein